MDDSMDVKPPLNDNDNQSTKHENVQSCIPELSQLRRALFYLFKKISYDTSDVVPADEISEASRCFEEFRKKYNLLPTNLNASTSLEREMRQLNHEMSIKKNCLNTIFGVDVSSSENDKMAEDFLSMMDEVKYHPENPEADVEMYEIADDMEESSRLSADVSDQKPVILAVQDEGNKHPKMFANCVQFPDFSSEISAVLVKASQERIKQLEVLESEQTPSGEESNDAQPMFSKDMMRLLKRAKHYERNYDMQKERFMNDDDRERMDSRIYRIKQSLLPRMHCNESYDHVFEDYSDDRKSSKKRLDSKTRRRVSNYIYEKRRYLQAREAGHVSKSGVDEDAEEAPNVATIVNSPISTFGKETSFNQRQSLLSAGTSLGSNPFSTLKYLQEMQDAVQWNSSAAKAVATDLSNSYFRTDNTAGCQPNHIISPTKPKRGNPILDSVNFPRPLADLNLQHRVADDKAHRIPLASSSTIDEIIPDDFGFLE